jgi:hypothetical protein
VQNATSALKVAVAILPIAYTRAAAVLLKIMLSALHFVYLYIVELVTPIAFVLSVELVT